MRSQFAFGQRPSNHAKASIRTASYKQAIGLKRLSICIFFVCLLLHAPTVLSTDNPDVESLIPRVRELYNAGKYQEAVPLAEQILVYTENVFGPEDALTAYGLSNLASLYTAMGEYAKAEPLYQRALEIREKALGPEHADTAVNLNNLGALYYQLGNYAKAEDFLGRASRICEKLFGPEDPHTADPLNNLAEVYRSMGEFAKAEPLYQRVLDICERTLGPNDPSTAVSVNNLALLYNNTGQFAKAEALHERALSIREKTLGPQHPDVANSLGNLAEVYRATGRYAKAETLYERALEIYQKVRGSEHVDTAFAVNNLAVVSQQMGDFGKAESLYQRALKICDKAVSPDHPLRVGILRNFAQFYVDKGDYSRGEQLLSEVVRIQERTIGPEHADTAVSLNNLAHVYNEIGDYAKAEALFQRALEISEKVFGPEHWRIATILNNEADVLERRAGYAKAEQLYERALKIREKALGLEHPETAISLNSLGNLYQEMGNYAKAKSLYERAAAICEKALGPQHPDTANSLNNLAQLYAKLGDYAKAESLHKRALNIREKALGPQHPLTAISLVNLAILQLDFANAPEARTLALQSEKTQLKVLSNILSFCSEQQRLAYQNKIYPYTLFAAIDGSDSELASTCLRYKGVVLDSIIEDRVLAEASQSKEDRDLVQRLNADKQRLGQMLLESQNKGEREMVRTLGVDKQQLGRMRLETPKVSADQNTKQIQQLEQEMERIEGKLARNVAGLGRPRRALAVTVEEVRAAIPANGALIEYVRYPYYLGKAKFEPRYGAIVLTAKGKPRWIPGGKADEIEKTVLRYRSQVADSETADITLKETLRGLFDRVWAPLEKALPNQTRTVIISPDGQLNFISFATLLTSKDRFLAEDHLVRYVSSGRDLLRDTKVAANSQLVAFGNPDFSLNRVAAEKAKPATAPQIALRGKTREELEELELDTLPFTKAECAALAERSKQWKWPFSLFLAADATEAELRKVHSPHILHLATHGFVLDAQKEDHAEPGLASSFELRKSRYFENPMHRFELALAGAQTTLDAWRKGEIPPTENDGIVTAEEVSTLNLEGTWLVTLSACNTGGGEAKSGEGVLGLRRGFIQAGAKNLLMTLWPIDDETTVDIMGEFYDAAHKTGNAPQALAEVQRDQLVKRRKTNGLVKAVNLAGPFILNSQGRP